MTAACRTVVDHQVLLRQLAEKLPGAALRLEPRSCTEFAGTLQHSLFPGMVAGRGMLVECLLEEAGAGGLTLVAAAIGPSTRASLGWVIVDAVGGFYPPGVVSSKAALSCLVVVRPRHAADSEWAVEQALRCPGVAMTWGWVDRVSERALRRWKLAVEAGGGVGVLFRSARVRREPSWADVRWLVKPLPAPRAAVRRWCVELLYCRGRLGGQSIDVELDHATGAVCVVPPVAGATPLRAATGA